MHPATLARSASAAPPDPLGDLLTALERRGMKRPQAPEAFADAEPLATLVLRVSDAGQLEQGLRELGRRGRRTDPASILRQLAACLPNRRSPQAQAAEARAFRAIVRFVLLSREPRQAAERFAALVRAGTAEFNRGALVRAGRLFELAERLPAAVAMEPKLLAAVRAREHHLLDPLRLGRLIERRQGVPDSLLRLFTVFAPERLVERFCRESRPGRRELLLSLIEAHGPAARAVVRARLAAPRAGGSQAGETVGLLQLLRRLPAPDADAAASAHELRTVAALLRPDGAPVVVAEALACLARARHPWAERALVLFLRELEALLVDTGGEGARPGRLVDALDRTAKALARQGPGPCWAALVEHGLRDEPALGDSAARLAALGVYDLAAAPELALWLIEAVNASLPSGFFSPLAAGQQPRVLKFLAALRGTRMPELRELLRFLAARFPLQSVGVEAARALAAAEARAAQEPPGSSLAGDLRLFGLPALLQTLSEGRVSGVLTLGEAPRPEATFVFEQGRLQSVRVGVRVGAAAVYQLLQRPVSGRFSFQHRRGVRSGSEASRALALPELILEGLRRFDELQQLARRVPDDLAFEATGRPPTVATGWDIDLATRLWEQVSRGATALACEEALAVDAWQVRRCLAHWLEDASLNPRPRATSPSCAA